MTYQETHWGPVIGGSLVADVRPGEVYAVKAVPLATPERCAVAGFLRMYRSRGIRPFADALAGWTWPSVNLVYAGASGSVGYTAVGLVPVRKANAFFAGVAALPGNTTRSDWQTFLPHALRPHVIDPARGHLHTANHLPIGSWYPLRSLFPGLGAGTRARRLGELLASQTTFTADEVLAMHLDRVNPNRRDLVTLGLHLRDRQGYALSARARQALRALQPWRDAGARMDATHGGVALAANLRSTLRRSHAGALVETYGAGQSGMTNFIEELLRGVRGNRRVTDAEARVLDGILVHALDTFKSSTPAAVVQGGVDAWRRHYVADTLTGALPLFTALGQPHPLDSGQVRYGPLIAADLTTNLSQQADCYTQFVIAGQTDGASSMLAIGQSEHPTSRHAADQLPLWERGQLKPSPTSVAGVARLGATDVVRLP